MYVYMCVCVYIYILLENLLRFIYAHQNDNNVKFWMTNKFQP